MNEQILAIGGSSLYPRGRGEKYMADKESTAKKDGEEPRGKTEAKGKKARVEKKKSSPAEEQQQRLKDLRREAEEAKASSKKTLEEAGGVDPAKVEQILQRLRESGQLQDIPIDKAAADAKLEAAKRAYEGKGENADVVLETEVGSNQVGIYRDRGRMVLTGLPDTKYKSEVLAKLFKEAGIAKKIDFPKDFNEWVVDKRREYVAENFGVHYRDNEIKAAVPTPDLIGPLVTPVANNPLAPYVADMKDAIVAAMPASISLERLKGIEEDLDEAVRTQLLKFPGGAILSHTDPELITARTALRSGIRSLEGVVSAERRQFQERDAGVLDFDEYFGEDFQRTREYIGDSTAVPPIPSNGAALRLIMEEVRTKAETIINWSTLAPVAFDVADPTTWPPEVSREEIRKLFEVTRALDQVARLTGGSDRILAALAGATPPTPADKELLNVFVSKDRQTKLLDRVDSFYNNIYSNLDKETQKVLAGDIEENAGPATDSIANGWHDFNPRMKRLFDVFNENEKFRGTNGALREWRGLFLIGGIETGVDYANLFKPPANWQDTPESLYALISAAEPLALGPQDLTPTLQAGYAMLNKIDTKTAFGRAMHFELKELLEAFKFKQSWVITAHVKSQDPTSLQHVYEEINGDLEGTFTSLISRFARDRKGRRWYTYALGGPDPKEVNLIDPAKALYSESLREDRIKMNMVEEMSKYSIDTPFTGAALRRIQEEVGYDNLPAARKATWLADLEETRLWLLNKRDHLVNPIDPLTGLIDYAEMQRHDGWFNKHNSTNPADWTPIAWGEGNMRGSSTKEAIKQWYERKTLHGAYGVIDEEGLAEISGWDDSTGTLTFVGVGEFADIFRRPGETDPQVGERIRKMFEKGVTTWQQVRRAEMKQRIRNDLKTMNLSYDKAVKYGERGEAVNMKLLTDDDLNELLESGYIDALDSNAYDLTWVIEWSNYQFIHIYGKGHRQGEDDYKALVVNQSSDNYNALIIDHNWEFMHEDFEDRGRERPGDVDEMFKKHFPGKHKWLFGHVSMGSRFITPFIAKNLNDQRLVRDRTNKLLREFPYYRTNEGPYAHNFSALLEGVAIRELVAEGAISFADRKFSEVVQERSTFNKFTPIDNAADRNLVLKFMGSGMIQKYLGKPSAEMFEKLTTKEDGFMSTRNPRLFPWMEFGLRAHWDVVHNLIYKHFSEPDITNQQMENFVENLVGDGFMDNEQGERFKKDELGLNKVFGVEVPRGPIRQFLGGALFRKLRNIFEEEERENQVKRRGWILRLLILFFWTIPLEGLIAGGKGAGEELKKQQH